MSSGHPRGVDLSSSRLLKRGSTVCVPKSLATSYLPNLAVKEVCRHAYIVSNENICPNFNMISILRKPETTRIILYTGISLDLTRIKV